MRHRGLSHDLTAEEGRKESLLCGPHQDRPQASDLSGMPHQGRGRKARVEEGPHRLRQVQVSSVDRPFSQLHARSLSSRILFPFLPPRSLFRPGARPFSPRICVFAYKSIHFFAVFGIRAGRSFISARAARITTNNVASPLPVFPGVNAGGNAVERRSARSGARAPLRQPHEVRMVAEKIAETDEEIIDPPN